MAGRPQEMAGRPQGSPLHFLVSLRVGETLAVSLLSCYICEYHLKGTYNHGPNLDAWR